MGEFRILVDRHDLYVHPEYLTLQPSSTRMKNLLFFLLPRKILTCLPLVYIKFLQEIWQHFFSNPCPFFLILHFQLKSSAELVCSLAYKFFLCSYRRYLGKLASTHFVKHVFTPAPADSEAHGSQLRMGLFCFDVGDFHYSNSYPS